MKRSNFILWVIILVLSLSQVNLYFKLYGKQEEKHEDYSMLFWIPKDSANTSIVRTEELLKLQKVGGWTRFEIYGGWVNNDSIYREPGYIYLISYLTMDKAVKMNKAITKLVKEDFGQKAPYILLFEEKRICDKH